MVKAVCECYYSLLSCGDWLILHHGLECFKHFAEVMHGDSV